MVEAKYGKPEDEVSLGEVHMAHSKYTKKEKIFAFFLLIFILLWIIFLALFINEKAKYNNIRNQLEQGQVRNENESSTVAPTNSTITKAPTNSTITKAPTAIPTQPDYGKGPWQKVRIPKYFKPVHYDIVLKVDLVQLIFSGNVQINVSLTTKVDCMYLHTNLLNITEPRLEDNQGRRLSLQRHFWYKKNQFYVLDPEDELLPGYYIIKMNFVGELKDDLKGLYKSTYKNKNGEEITIAATQLQPTDARKVFPCFDEPSFKATFQVTIHRANNMISITNTPKMKTEKQSNDISADYYHKTVIMPTYLLAFVVCDFEYEQEYAGKKNSSMRYYAPSNQIDQTKLARSVGGKILEKFENYFNITYPLQKADMIAIPDFAAGAMENWGLITYRETALLFKEGQSSESNKERITLVISHELAHMWFGNLVTTEWWDDLWLNEGFASYVEYIGIDHVFPEWKIKDIFVVTDMQQAFSLDGLVTSHPILLAVEHPDEINEIFDSISYSKGAAILRMLDNFLGEKTFQKGLINYLNEFSYSNAKTKDLWRFLAKASAEDGSNLNVSEIMDTWTLQMNYPVINVTLRNKEIVLTQKRFLSDPEADESAAKYNSSYGYKWFVPFTIEVRDSNTSDKISSNETKTIWMEPSDDNVTVENKTVDATKQWVKGNIGQTGFYLINYDENNWQMLAKQLIFDHEVLSISDRAGLIQDVFALANADQLQYKYALDMTKYLDNEMEYVPWRAAIRSLNIILSLLPSTSDMGKRLMNYRFNKIKHLHNKLGYNDTGTHLEKYIRSYIIESACSLKKEVCMSRVKEYFDNWIKNETKYPVPANLRSAVYFYGMSQSGEKEWDIMFDRFLKTNVASERRKLMYGLAGINEPWLIVRYLEYAFDKSKIKSQDTNTVVSYVANYNPIGRHFAWSFMKEKWPVILETYGKGFAFLMNSFVSTVTAGFNTEWELEQVKDFYAKYPQSGTGSRARQQVLETIKSQMTWRKKNEKLVKEWLDQNNIN